MNYKTLNDLQDIVGKRVILRCDFNVPIKDGDVVDDFRIRQAFPTIDFLIAQKAKIIIISHIEGETHTLKPVFEYLKTLYPITFCEDCIESGKETINNLKDGEILLFENLRLYDGEKKNDQEFAKKLAAYADLYVNDAFSVSHRKHASVVGIPKYIPGYLGFQFEKEVANLSKAFSPEHPFVFILGGAKFDTKLPLVEKFLPLADTIFIGGALANDFYKAQGLEVGTSKTSETTLDLNELLKDSKIVVPPDVVVSSSEDTSKKVKKANAVEKNESILDAGPESIALLKEKCEQARYILWNGPLGNYENGYTEPTEALARIIAGSSALSIVGGGDTLAAIAKLGIEDKFSFMSTGGGAMLDFLAKGTLPGLDALKK